MAQENKETVLEKIQKHPVVAAIILATALVGGIAAFLNNIEAIGRFFQRPPQATITQVRFFSVNTTNGVEVTITNRSEQIQVATQLTYTQDIPTNEALCQVLTEQRTPSVQGSDRPSQGSMTIAETATLETGEDGTTTITGSVTDTETGHIYISGGIYTCNEPSETDTITFRTSLSEPLEPNDTTIVTLELPPRMYIAMIWEIQEEIEEGLISIETRQEEFQIEIPDQRTNTPTYSILIETDTEAVLEYNHD